MRRPRRSPTASAHQLRPQWLGKYLRDEIEDLIRNQEAPGGKKAIGGGTKDDKQPTAFEDLPPPDVLQQEIVEHLEAALSAFRDVAAALPRFSKP